MNRIALTILLFAASFAAGAADDLKISQLEQDVRDLQRQVRAQSQEIEELRRRLARPADQLRLPSSSTPAAPNGGLWLDASRWQQVKVGMSELEVISLLGPPASMRARDEERVLLYAMEIGSSGFLSGSITLRDRVVLKVQNPSLQ
jgi:outer membrane murein-binding lipoprotein Lpp